MKVELASQIISITLVLVLLEAMESKGRDPCMNLYLARFLWYETVSRGWLHDLIFQPLAMGETAMERQKLERRTLKLGLASRMEPSTADDGKARRSREEELVAN
jgi:hypothetical protein